MERTEFVTRLKAEAKALIKRLEEDPACLISTTYQERITRFVYEAGKLEGQQIIEIFNLTLTLLMEVTKAASKAPQVTQVTYMAKCPKCGHGLHWDYYDASQSKLQLKCSNAGGCSLALPVAT